MGLKVLRGRSEQVKSKHNNSVFEHFIVDVYLGPEVKIYPLRSNGNVIFM
jgi:hypothetical protein